MVLVPPTEGLYALLELRSMQDELRSLGHEDPDYGLVSKLDVWSEEHALCECVCVRACTCMTPHVHVCSLNMHRAAGDLAKADKMAQQVKAPVVQAK